MVGFEKERTKTSRKREKQNGRRQKAVRLEYFKGWANQDSTMTPRFHCQSTFKTLLDSNGLFCRPAALTGSRENGLSYTAAPQSRNLWGA